MPISRSTTRPDTAGSSEPARRDQRIAFIQFGDFLQSAQSFAHGGPETYYAQRYSVELVEGLCKTYAGVMVLCVDTGPYDQELPSGVRCMGFRGGIWRAEGKRQVVDRLGSWGPTTVVVRTPCRFLIAHCMEAGWRVLPLLADSFLGAGLRGRFSNWRLARLLNRPQIELVANHQVPAARDLVRLGVNPAKVVPWDWPSMSHPSDYPVKTGIGSAGEVTVMYAGSVVENKGVGELIHAIATINRTNVTARATIAGGGDIDHFRRLASSLGVSDRITFTGLVPHTRIVPMMHEHDVVVIPAV